MKATNYIWMVRRSKESGKGEGEMENLVILGSTGSIGRQSLEIVEKFSDRFRVIGLSAKSNIKVLAEQVEKYKPKYVWIPEEKKSEFEKIVKFRGFEYVSSLRELVSAEDVSFVISGIPGFASVEPVFYAVSSGKKVAVASKEAILCSGELLFSVAKRKKAKILPVDSEHSSLWRILDFYPRYMIKKVMITASGGPFWNSTKSEIENAKLEDALKHPVWNMGVKITVDSAMLMNKAFEIIEACYLFSLAPDDIYVKIHPEAIVHSAVELRDGTIIASAHYPDMRIPIMYAMMYPDVPEIPFEVASIWNKPLHFFDPDFERFPSLLLGWKCAKLGMPFPCILVSADDFTVEKYLNGKIKFGDIYRIVDEVISYFERKKDEIKKPKSFEDIKKVYEETKKITDEVAKKYEENKD